MEKKLKDIFEVLSREHMMVIRGGFAFMMPSTTVRTAAHLILTKLVMQLMLQRRTVTQSIRLVCAVLSTSLSLVPLLTANVHPVL